MPRAAKPTRLPGGGLSVATEPDFFVKQGDFQALAAGRPMMYYRDQAKAQVDWVGGWREFFEKSFPDQVAAVDSALGTTPSEDDDQFDGDDVA